MASAFFHLRCDDRWGSRCAYALFVLAILFIPWQSWASQKDQPFRFFASGDSPIEITHVESIQESLSPTQAVKNWDPIKLPDVWLKSRPEFSGIVWYRFQIELDSLPVIALAVWLPQFASNADVWVNGILQGSNGNNELHLRPSRHWNLPLLQRLAFDNLKVGINTVAIRVRADSMNNGSLSPPWFGAEDSLRYGHQVKMWIRQYLSAACNLAVFVLGIVFAFFRIRNTADRHFGYFSAAAILWAISMSNLNLTEIPFDHMLWEMISKSCTVWSGMALVLFGLHYKRKHNRSVDIFALTYGLCFFLMMLLTPGNKLQVVFGYALIPVLAFALLGLIKLLGTFRKYSFWSDLFFILAATGTLWAGIADSLIILGIRPLNSTYTMVFAMPFLMGVITWALSGTYVDAQKQLSLANHNLKTRLEEREGELERSFEKIKSIEVFQATLNERERILKEMHDGVGSNLVTALRQMETPGQDLEHVKTSLREAMDFLRLSVDSLSLPNGDLNALLASLRFRLGPRLANAKVALIWDVDELNPSNALDSPGAIKAFQLMFFEIISNALQHSGTERIRVEAKRTLHDGNAIVVRDYGSGFDIHQGIPKAIRSRASELGLRLTFESSCDGTSVIIIV